MESLSRAMKATDKAKLIDRIKSIDGLTDDERSALLGLLNESKTYGLVWEDKPEEVEERLRTELPVLKEVKSRAIISGNADTPNHILIEGDNLEALTTLAYTHEGKIDVIYIDPPYNTGNKDFFYNDSFVDGEDSFRHSKWLSFISKRLRIAKKLLSENGVIFISIDGNELANLKILCDEIFGIQNHAGIITRKQSSGAKNDIGQGRITTNADYIIVYAKSDFSFLPIYEKSTKSYPRSDVEGYFSPRALEMQGDADTLPERPKMGYSVYHRESDNKIVTLFDYDITNNPVYERPNESYISQGYICYRPRKRGNSLGRWRWGVETFEEKHSQNLVHFENGRIFIKERAKSSTPKYPDAIWDEYLNTLGTNEVKEILGGRAFSFPKPVALIKKIIQHSPGNVILDFFAGSGTTLHAVMQLNAEDGGHRQCILCTNNENGICENVTYERNKRVIQGYTKPNGEFVEGLHDNNLRYYRTAYVGRRRTPQNMRRLMLLASDMLCIKEDLYKEIDEFAGMPTLENGFRFFDDGKKQMLIIYNEEAIYEIVEAIEKINVERPIITYVFSPANDPWRLEFESVSEKVELTALPAAIYNAYKRVLPKAKDLLLSTPPESQPPKKEVPDNLFDFEEEKEEKGGEE